MATFDITTINIIRASVALILMLIASAMDLKSRVVKDKVWLAMGVTGLILLVSQLTVSNAPLMYHIILIPIIIIFADVFFDREPLYDSKRRKLNLPWLFAFALAGFILMFLLWKFYSDINFLAILTVPVMMLVSYVLYYTGILHGGADAKGLLALSMLLPLYPVIGNIPLWNLNDMGQMTTVIIPFSLTILMNAAIISVFLPLGLALYNISKRDFKGAAIFLGYRVPIDQIDRKRMWLMEKIKDGKLVIRYMPERYDDDDLEDENHNNWNSEEKNESENEDNNDKLEDKLFRKDLENLREYGHKKVWVSPKLPFVVFMTAGLIISLILGNLLFGLISGIISLGK